MTKPTKEQVLGSYEPVVGFDENVKQVKKILRRSGRLNFESDIMTEAVASLVWCYMASRVMISKQYVTENDLDAAMMMFYTKTKEYFDG